MTYNPDIHHRRSIRLRGYDYSSAGAYFITICARNRECLFGEIVDGDMRLNLQGMAVESAWLVIPGHFPGTVLGVYVVMPNHLHGILTITPYHVHHVGAKQVTSASPLRLPQPANGTQTGSIGAIVQNFKSVSTRKINKICNTPGQPVWQRNYYERVIRNDDELTAYCDYINTNPQQWEQDTNNPGAPKPINL